MLFIFCEWIDTNGVDLEHKEVCCHLYIAYFVKSSIDLLFCIYHYFIIININKKIARLTSFEIKKCCCFFAVFRCSPNNLFGFLHYSALVASINFCLPRRIRLSFITSLQMMLSYTFLLIFGCLVTLFLCFFFNRLQPRSNELLLIYFCLIFPLFSLYFRLHDAPE